MSFSESKELLDTLLCKFSSRETCSLDVLQQMTKVLTKAPVLKPSTVHNRGRLGNSEKLRNDISEMKKEVKTRFVKNDVNHVIDKAQFAIKVFNESLKLLSEIVKLSCDDQNSHLASETEKQMDHDTTMNGVVLKKHIVNCSLLSFNIVKENSSKLNIKQLGICKAHANIINRLIDLEMTSMAFYELITLRNDLECYVKLIAEKGFWAKFSEENRSQVCDESKTKSEIVAWLINIKSSVNSMEEDVVNFISGFQLMVLKCASRFEDMTLDESLLNSFNSCFGPKAFFRRLNELNPKLGKNQTNILHRVVLKLYLHDSKIEEHLEDLIYFVLDIFQFHGETVAYDEIDIDQIVVDFQEAISNYNKESSSLLEQEHQHLILVLDKSVQSFPWESLPCLRKSSISRVPSLYCIYDRLNMVNFDAYQKVNRKSGCYVLNPSSDLINTQNSFETLLKNIDSWEGIVGRAPEELELQTFLSSFEIFLYFGHGGGEQYIRKNTVKRLSKCAVSFLMGCSSGVLKDMGDFEPIGMATSYLLAGCPALVANLWDVTDKDIDRFSISVLKYWGLIPNDLESYQSGKAESKTGKSLVEAVAFSRDQCVLKYLNGAAPVIYGIPIYLE
ncbi:hypothetical protein PCK2_000373 [Pneumocystis canis]|nr:hypothetical protein PCK2_000373 [Pneumocystis canis]